MIGFGRGIVKEGILKGTALIEMDFEGWIIF